MKSILLGIAGMAVAAQFVIAQPEPPVPPEPPAIADVPEIFELPVPPIPPVPPLAGDMENLASQLAVLAQVRPAQPPQPPQPVPMPSPARGRYNPERSSEDSLYRNGQRHLDRREYDSAVEAFDAAAMKRGPKADGAHYWKAYALVKLGRRDEALATIAELQKSHSGSR